MASTKYCYIFVLSMSLLKSDVNNVMADRSSDASEELYKRPSYEKETVKYRFLMNNCGLDSSWFFFGNHCYQLVSTIKDWDIAQSFCRHMGSNLASIHSEAETRFLFDLIRSNSNVRSETLWIGLRAVTRSSNSFRWDDGSELDYRNWNRGEPNNDLNVPEDCGQIIARNGFWNDAPCSGRMGFICKKLALIANSTPKPRNPTVRIRQKLTRAKNHSSKSVAVDIGIALGCLLMGIILTTACI